MTVIWDKGSDNYKFHYYRIKIFKFLFLNSNIVVLIRYYQIYLQRTGHMGILCSRSFDRDTGGNKEEILGTARVLRHDRYDGGYHNGN